jgi:hypothetical protein
VWHRIGLNVRNGMAQTIWSVIAVIGGVGTIAVILWFLVTGAHDRDEEEAARRYFDEHGHWPDESPTPSG